MSTGGSSGSSGVPEGERAAEQAAQTEPVRGGFRGRYRGRFRGQYRGGRGRGTPSFHYMSNERPSQEMLASVFGLQTRGYFHFRQREDRRARPYSRPESSRRHQCSAQF